MFQFNKVILLADIENRAQKVRQRHSKIQIRAKKDNKIIQTSVIKLAFTYRKKLLTDKPIPGLKTHNGVFIFEINRP
jgi:hypothetical protein